MSWLKNRDDVNPNKIGVLGFSNGATSALVLSNHKMLNEQAAQLAEAVKSHFVLPYESQYQANTIVALYPGCGLNGYQPATQNIFADNFDSNTEVFLFVASQDTHLPDDTLTQCHGLRNLDAQSAAAQTNLQMRVVPDTDHQFDYKQAQQPAVAQAIRRILALFGSM